MVYEYQKETLEYLTETRGRLEKLTDSRMSLRIGIIRGDYLNVRGTEYYEETRDLYFCLNHRDGYIDTTFKSIGDFDSGYGVNDTDYIRFNKNLFIKLNELIDKIYKDKSEREEFHRKLNLELQALNKSL